MRINIQHPVALFPQPTNMTCWSAAATMLFGDRSIGSGGAKLDKSGGLVGDYSNLRAFALAHGLILHAPQSWTTEGLAGLLWRGPMMVCGNVPRGHCFVIGSMRGDGTAMGTEVKYYDPRPVGSGKVGWMKYGALMQRYPMATRYILHR